MKLLILGSGPLAEQARRLAQAAAIPAFTADAVPDGWDGPILPATEAQALLDALPRERALFDADAWRLTSSRLASDAFLREHGVAIPAYFPACTEPYFFKPDRGSGGRGTGELDDYCEAGGAVNAGFVVQELLSGAPWSAVVSGRPGRYTAHPPAKLTYEDGRRVSASCAGGAEPLRETALAIAEMIGVHGLLEVEAIPDGDVWKVIDLNARLPLLTPDALLRETGVNLLTVLMELWND